MKRLAILGASGHGKVVAEIAELNGWDVVFFDDAFPSVNGLAHWPVIGTTEDLLNDLQRFDGCFVAIGNNRIRLDKQTMLTEKGATLPVLIHPLAVISRYANVQAGCVVMAGAVVNPFALVQQACIVNTASTIDHDCILAEGVHISPGANLAGGVSVGACSWIGIGASVKQCVQIGANVVVGAGAAVVSDIADNLTVVGVPARALDSFFSDGASRCARDAE
ncbi:MAG: acetyltransferase [Gammaproteobacteria bacterium]|nr:acetyltransferase [Gammaproteobacteria bacterium]MBD3822498.1 acetyltransferase [Thiotrichales bacterium]